MVHTYIRPNSCTRYGSRGETRARYGSRATQRKAACALLMRGGNDRRRSGRRSSAFRYCTVRG